MKNSATAMVVCGVVAAGLTGCSGPVAEVSVRNATGQPIVARVVAQVGDGVDGPQPIDPATGEPRPVPVGQSKRVTWEFEVLAGQRVTQAHEFIVGAGVGELGPTPSVVVELESGGVSARGITGGWGATVRGVSPMRVEVRRIDGELRIDPQQWMDRNYTVEWRGR